MHTSRRTSWTLLVLATLAWLKPERSARPQPGGTHATPGTTRTPERPRQTVLSRNAKRSTDDLDKIESRGELRVLMHRSEVGLLARRATPWLHDVEDAEAFAESLGLDARFVLVDQASELIDALIGGRGDLSVGAELRSAKAQHTRVSFARSEVGIDEIVIQKAGTPNPPTRPDELDGRRVVIPADSPYAETLVKLKKRTAPNLEIVLVPEDADTETLVERVVEGDGTELTVVDGHLLAVFEAYVHGIERLFALENRTEMTWAVRRHNVRLRAALDRFTFERAMTGHRERIRTGDLAEIKRRGVLRVLSRNNTTAYFLFRGRPFGFEYELAKRLAKDLGVRLEMVVPPRRSDLIPWLLEGRGDVIAAGMTITRAREKRVAFSRPYQFAREVLVGRKGTEAPTNPSQLAGKTVHVRLSSSHADTLRSLKARGIALRIAAADEAHETDAILRDVGDGTIEWTVANDKLVQVEQAYGVPVETSLVLATANTAENDPGRPIGFAVRPTNPALRSALDAFVRRRYRGREYNEAKKRYFENRRAISRHHDHRFSMTGVISPYDELLKKYATKYGFDWRLLAAQAYVESRFNARAKSWAGATGLFQVMPQTGRDLGFTNLEDPENSVHAGAKYMARLLRRFDPKLPLQQRVQFALAAYNAGLGHILDARRLARREGLDPDRWFGHVERAILKLSKSRYAHRARYGFCRGAEPVAYVSHIQDLYEAYVEVAKRR